MTVGELTDADVEDVVALWQQVELTRPSNDPVTDFRRALIGPKANCGRAFSILR
jgi:hypothetical protein